MSNIEKHSADFQPQIWKQYTMQELGSWVHLLTKRAEHRANVEKRAKDFYDAQNYLDMMQLKLDALK